MSLGGKELTKGISCIAVVLSGISINCYALSTERVTTYTGVDGAYSGYIEAGDPYKILEVYASDWVKVSYSVAQGNKRSVCRERRFFC